MHFLQRAPGGPQVLLVAGRHICAWALSQGDIQLLFSRLLPLLARFYSEFGGAVDLHRDNHTAVWARPVHAKDSGDTPGTVSYCLPGLNQCPIVCFCRARLLPTLQRLPRQPADIKEYDFSTELSCSPRGHPKGSKAPNS